MKVLFTVIDSEEDEVVGSYIVEAFDMETAKKSFIRCALPFFPPMEICFAEMQEFLNNYDMKIVVVNLDSAKTLQG